MKGLAYLKRSNSIFIRTLVTYILIFMIPFALFGISIYYWASSTVTSQTNRTYLGLLEDARKDVERNFEGLDTFAVQLAYMPWAAKLMYMEGNSFSYDRVDIGEVLNSLKELSIYKSTHPFIDQISIYFNGKDTMLSTLGKDNFERFFLDLLHYDRIDLETLQQILKVRNNHRILLPEQVSMRGQKHSLLTYVQSLPPSDSRFQATLLLHVREETLQQMLNKSSLAENNSIYVLDAQGNFVTGVNPDEQIGAYIADRYSDPAAATGIDNIKLAGGKPYSLYRSEPGRYGWSYYIAVPTGTVLSKLHVIRNAAIGLSLFYLCIGLGLSYLLAMRNYKPLANILHMVRSKLLPEQHAGNEFHYLENAVFTMLTDAGRSEREISLYKPLARNTCLLKLLNKESVHDDSLSRAMNMLDIAFPDEYLVCASLLLSEEQVIPEPFYDQVRSELETLGVTIYWVEIEERNKAVILNAETKELADAALHAIGECLRASSVAYRSIGVGAYCTRLVDLPRSYEESLRAVEYRFLKEDGSLIHAGEFAEDADRDWSGYLAEEEQLIRVLRGGDARTAKQISREMIRRYLDKHRLSPDAVRYLGYNVAAVAFKALEEANINQAPSVHLKDMMQIETMEDMIVSIERLYEEVAQLLSQEKDQHNVQLIGEIRDYIHSHYNDQNLSLTKVADAFRISTSYLSRYFKNQTGSNFIDYVNRRRIEASKPFLNGDATILQVAQKVGFDNDITYRRLFKKYMGVTPGQFKN